MTLDATHAAPGATKRASHDAHQRRAWLRTAEIARRIVEEPELVTGAQRFIEKFVRDDPHQVSAYRVWSGLLRRPPAQIAAALLEDSPHGAELRETAPVFVAFSREELRDIWARG